jgi:hypothetical protein
MSTFLNLIQILRREDKIKFLFLFFLIIINVFLEMIGIGLVFPILGFLLSEKFLIEYSGYLNSLNFFF